MAEQELLVRSASDINETWVLNLLQYHHNPTGISTTRLRKWSLHDFKSQDTLGGGCSSRVTVKVEYERVGEVETPEAEEQLKEDTFVVKTVPSQGHMVDMLTSEGLHHIEVNQYERFLRALGTWEAERRGVDVDVGVGVMAEIVPSHVLAVSDDRHFTLVLPDLTQLGYQTRLLEEGLSEAEVMVTARALGRYHGTVVAFKMVTKTNLQESFPTCFHVAHGQSELITYFQEKGFKRLRDDWRGVPERAALLSLLEPYETHATAFVVHNLHPTEPFATAVHGDPQPTNIMFKYTADGGCTLKLIDWAQARYSRGTYDLVYMLSIGVEPDVRRQVSSQAKEEYFKAFNDTLKDLDAGITYPRNVFDEDMMLSEQLSVVWAVSSINLLYSTASLQRRLYCIINDVIHNPTIKPLHFFLPESARE